MEGYFGKGSYQGPDECASDSIESKYFNNDEVCSVPGWGGVPSDVFLGWDVFPNNEVCSVPFSPPMMRSVLLLGWGVFPQHGDGEHNSSNSHALFCSASSPPPGVPYTHDEGCRFVQQSTLLPYPRSLSGSSAHPTSTTQATLTPSSPSTPRSCKAALC